jgi:hypothetical protein
VTPIPRAFYSPPPHGRAGGRPPAVTRPAGPPSWSRADRCAAAARCTPRPGRRARPRRPAGSPPDRTPWSGDLLGAAHQHPALEAGAMEGHQPVRGPALRCGIERTRPPSPRPCGGRRWRAASERWRSPPGGRGRGSTAAAWRPWTGRATCPGPPTSSSDAPGSPGCGLRTRRPTRPREAPQRPGQSAHAPNSSTPGSIGARESSGLSTPKMYGCAPALK